MVRQWILQTQNGKFEYDYYNNLHHHDLNPRNKTWRNVCNFILFLHFVQLTAFELLMAVIWPFKMLGNPMMDDINVLHETQLEYVNHQLLSSKYTVSSVPHALAYKRRMTAIFIKINVEDFEISLIHALFVFPLFCSETISDSRTTKSNSSGWKFGYISMSCRWWASTWCFMETFSIWW